MPKHPNAPGGGNRQGPKVTSQGKRGPITGKMTSVAGKTAPWDMSKGKASGAGRNASGHNWKRKPPH
jgi:hypothetical protein